MFGADFMMMQVTNEGACYHLNVNLNPSPALNVRDRQADAEECSSRSSRISGFKIRVRNGTLEKTSLLFLCLDVMHLFCVPPRPLF